MRTERRREGGWEGALGRGELEIALSRRPHLDPGEPKLLFQSVAWLGPNGAFQSQRRKSLFAEGDYDS